MFRSDTQPVTARKRGPVSGTVHASVLERVPLDAGGSISHERADPGVVLFNGLALWAVLSAVGMLVWRGVM
jgi:hypothetical protein